MKICSKCKIEKNEREFRIRKDRLCGLRSQCRECDKKYHKSKSGRAAAKRFRQSEKGRSYYRNAIKEFEKTNKGKAIRKKYRQSEKGRNSHRKNHIKRRDLEAGFDSDLSLEDIKIIKQRFDNLCFNCGTSDKLEIDHHYPLTKGYGLSLNNAVLLCRSCNCSKYNKMPEEFYNKEQLEKLHIILGLPSGPEAVLFLRAKSAAALASGVMNTQP